MSLLEILMKPLLKAQWEAWFEIGYAQAKAANLARARRTTVVKLSGGNVQEWVRYESCLASQRSDASPKTPPARNR